MEKNEKEMMAKKDLSLVRRVLEAGKKAGADKAFWEDLHQNEELFKTVVMMVRLSKGPTKSIPKFSIEVDRALSFRGAIESAQQTVVSQFIAENILPRIGETRRLMVHIVRFREKTNFEEVMYTLKNLELEPLGLRELLALMANYPKLQNEHNVVALGTVLTVHGKKYAPVAYVDIEQDFENCIDVIELDQSWDSGTVFPAIRKPDSLGPLIETSKFSFIGL
jgi:hypothetical protein